MDRYKPYIKQIWHVPDALSGCMGNLSFIANFKTKKEMTDFFDEVTKEI